MRAKTMLIALLGFLLLANCTGKPKQSLPDELPQQTNEETVHLNTAISPPPPGKTDAADTTSVIATEKVSQSDTVYKIAEVDFLAAYPHGGWGGFTNHIQSVRYPKAVEEQNIGGYIAVLFVVEKDGSVSNIEIIQSVNELVDNAIIQALQIMPPWKPAKKNGMYVRSNYAFTLVF